MSDIKLKHASGVFKSLPSFPEYDDVLYMIKASKKKAISLDELTKLAGCDQSLLLDPVAQAVEKGNIEYNPEAEKYTVINLIPVKVEVENEPTE